MSNQEKIQEIATLLGVDPSWLSALINYESSFNPLAKNPYSSARGLIQVMDSTAQDTFGYPDSLSLISDFPDFDSQMDNVVFMYLKKQMPYTTKQSLYMAVFFPVARFVDPSTTFQSLYEKYYTDADTQYAKFKTGNPGILTVADYVRKVDSHAGILSPENVKTGGSILLLAALAIGGYILFRKYS